MSLFDSMRDVPVRSRQVSEIVTIGAADDIRLYRALCVLGHLPWNLSLFCRDVYRGKLGGTIGYKALYNWVREDPICIAIASQEDSDVKTEWLQKAEAEFASWD